MKRSTGGKADYMKNRETGFSLDFRNEKLPKYDPLYDRNLKKFFENSQRQKQMYSVGLIDDSGRVIDLEKNKSKLFIIDQEFRAAEKAEMMRMKEEEHMRYRVQKKRLEILENASRNKMMNHMRDDRVIRRQIMEATRSPLNASPYNQSTTPKAKKKK